MARAEISETVSKTLSGFLAPAGGASVQVNVRGGGAATVYAAATGAATVANPVPSDAAGRIEGWLEPGSYDLVVSGSGFATYTQRFEAVSGELLRVLSEAPLNLRDHSSYAMVADGTDQTSKLNAALSAVHTAGGGPLYLPRGSGGAAYRIDGAVQLPNLNPGTSYPKQNGLRLFGDTETISGRSNANPQGGTILDMRHTGTAKILTLGDGVFELDHLTLRNESSDATPFLYTTGTVLKVHHVGFFGQSSKSGSSCDQDAIILGGTDAGAGDGTANSPFQGYGTVIENCYFSKIRRAAFLRTYCNAVVIRDNWIGHACGSNLAGGACFELLGHSTNSCGGNVFLNNQLEVIAYPYPFKGEWAVQNVFAFNSFYDESATTLAYYRMEANAVFNTIVAGVLNGAYPTISEVGAALNTNTVIMGAQGQQSRFPQGIDTRGILQARSLVVDGGNGSDLTQPAANVSNEGFPLKSIKRSAAQTTNGNAGATVWELLNGGAVFMGALNGSTPGTPSGGGYFWVDAAGNLKYKGPSGTVTTLAPA